MTKCINFETEIDTQSDEEEDLSNNDISETYFVDDDEIETSVNFYRQFENVENDIEEILTETHNEAIKDIEKFDDISNLNDGSDHEMEIDDFKESGKDIAKFNETLFPKDSTNNKNQFFKVVLYAIKVAINGTQNICTREDFEKVIEKKLVEQIWQPEKRN